MDTHLTGSGPIHGQDDRRTGASRAPAATAAPPRELRYMLRLYAMELVLENFPGYERGELLERMIELSLYTEEHLR